MQEQAAGTDPFAKVDRWINTARHMLAFGAGEDDVLAKLTEDGADSLEAFHALTAAKLAG